MYQFQWLPADERYDQTSTLRMAGVRATSRKLMIRYSGSVSFSACTPNPPAPENRMLKKRRCNTASIRSDHGHSGRTLICAKHFKTLCRDRYLIYSERKQGLGIASSGECSCLAPKFGIFHSPIHETWTRKSKNNDRAYSQFSVSRKSQFKSTQANHEEMYDQIHKSQIALSAKWANKNDNTR